MNYVFAVIIGLIFLIGLHESIHLLSKLFIYYVDKVRDYYLSKEQDKEQLTQEIKTIIYIYFKLLYDDFKVELKESEYTIFFCMNKELILYNDACIERDNIFMDFLIFKLFPKLEKISNKDVILYYETEEYFEANRRVNK